MGNKEMNVSGLWYNELGSSMEIKVSGTQITGIYNTAVGDASKNYQLTGWVNSAPSDDSFAMGWSVLWNNQYGDRKSLTSWAGQYQLNPNGDEEIYTFWLLAQEKPSKDDWAATQVGQDTFTRQRPTDQQVKTARVKRAHSFPLPLQNS